MENLGLTQSVRTADAQALLLTASERSSPFIQVDHAEGNPVVTHPSDILDPIG